MVRFVAGVLATTALPIVISAQTPSKIELDTVTVVSRKAAKTLKSTAPVFKLDNAQFNRLGVTDISDAIHRLPGVNLRDYGGLGGLKTVSVRGLGSQHTAVVYDGIVLSDCQSGEVDVARYSLDNVESLSMVIGDNDDIFQPARVAASAASFSISSFRRPDPDKPLDLTAQVKYGSFGYVNPYVRVGKAFTEKFSMNLIGDYTYAENDYPFRLKNGQHTVTERRNNSRMNSGHGELNAIWSPDSRSNLSAKLYYYDNDRQIPGPAIYYTNENHETLRDRNFFGQLQYRNAFTSKWSL
ncbi:MAG: TonB-dependent receptor plug domain-containing protein, partial [Duncaniella sp.]|nr:TonB-dependent receptor plug domain-containing protein [Duncaniella sp.]